MKKRVDGEFRHLCGNNAIPRNRTEPAMPSEVREFAEMLAEIAARHLRSQPIISQGEQLHE